MHVFPVINKYWTMILVCLLCLLVACVTEYGDSVAKPERLKAFIFDNKRLYVLGQENDYLFENEDIVALQEFLQTDYAKDVFFVHVQINTINHIAQGEYAIYLDPSKYTAQQLDELQRKYWFNPISQVSPKLMVAVHQQSPDWRADQPALKRQYRATGKIARLTNKNEWLSSYQSLHDMPVVLQQRYTKRRFLLAEPITVALVVPAVVATTAMLVPVLAIPLIVIRAGQ